MPAPKGNKYALGNKGGAPTLYKPEYCEQLIEWFSGEPYRVEEIPHYRNGQVSWIDKKLIPNKLPTFHTFATHIGVTPQVIPDWAKRHEEFGRAYAYAKELQKYFLIENGLNGIYNAAAFTFVAKNITDMHDKHEIESTGEPFSRTLYIVGAKDKKELREPEK
jgi:hypothetical protein